MAKIKTDPKPKPKSSSKPKSTPKPKSSPKKSDAAFTVNTRFSAVRFRIYAEQCGYTGDRSDFEAQVEVLHNTLCRIRSIPSDRFFIDAAIHDMDFDKSDPLNPRPLKPHAHIVVWYRGRERGKQATVRFSSYLNVLSSFGVNFRFPDDNNLVFGDVDRIRVSVQRKDHIGLVAYMDHDTFDAREDGKHLYLPLEFNFYRYCNNLAIARSLIDFYHKNMDYERNSKTGNIVMTKNDWKLEMFDKARAWGLAGKPLTSFIDSLDNRFKLGDYDKAINKGYVEGATKWMLESSDCIDHIRCCIFINGKPDVGKSHNSALALKEIVGKTLDVRGGKTGKFDELTSDTKGLVVSDTGMTDYHAMLDDACSFAYRRNNSNPLNCTDYTVLTYNGSFFDYMKAYAGDWFSSIPAESKQALVSRLYHCDCDENGLHLRQACQRGANQEIRDGMFLKFFDAFNKHQQEYMKIKHNKTSVSGPNTARVLSLIQDWQPINESTAIDFETEVEKR